MNQLNLLLIYRTLDSINRTPDSINSTFALLERVLQRVEAEGKVVMLIGDVNCDLLKPCCYTKTLQEMCGKYHLRQLIKDPTRITEDSETLVDHVNGWQLAKMKKSIPDMSLP